MIFETVFKNKTNFTYYYLFEFFHLDFLLQIYHHHFSLHLWPPRLFLLCHWIHLDLFYHFQILLKICKQKVDFTQKKVNKNLISHKKHQLKVVPSGSAASSLTSDCLLRPKKRTRFFSGEDFFSGVLLFSSPPFLRPKFLKNEPVMFHRKRMYKYICLVTFFTAAFFQHKQNKIRAEKNLILEKNLKKRYCKFWW